MMNVLNGGSMYQHVTDHNRDHWIYDTFFDPDEMIKVTSAHHQMMIPDDSAEILGYSEGISKEFFGQSGKVSTPKFESEVLWYPRTRSLCFQPHPEWRQSDGLTQCKDYFFKLIEALL